MSLSIFIVVLLSKVEDERRQSHCSNSTFDPTSKMKSVIARHFANSTFPYIAAPGTPEAILSVCDLGLNLVEKVQCKLSSLIALLRDQIEEFRIVGVDARAR